jgi:hypothetical protein
MLGCSRIPACTCKTGESIFILRTADQSLVNNAVNIRQPVKPKGSVTICKDAGQIPYPTNHKIRLTEPMGLLTLDLATVIENNYLGMSFHLYLPGLPCKKPKKTDHSRWDESVQLSVLYRYFRTIIHDFQ